MASNDRCRGQEGNIFSSSSIEYVKHIGYFPCFPSKHEATVEGKVELFWFVLSVFSLC